MIRTLDLHGIRHEAARQSVIHLIEDNWNTDNELEVVTGNSIKMKEIVRSVAKEYNLETELGQGYHRHRIIIFMGEDI